MSLLQDILDGKVPGHCRFGWAGWVAPTGIIARPGECQFAGYQPSDVTVLQRAYQENGWALLVCSAYFRNTTPDSQPINAAWLVGIIDDTEYLVSVIDMSSAPYIIDPIGTVEMTFQFLTFEIPLGSLKWHWHLS